jgi:D-alanyl-D-alanine dipeptidase
MMIAERAVLAQPSAEALVISKDRRRRVGVVLPVGDAQRPRRNSARAWPWLGFK